MEDIVFIGDWIKDRVLGSGSFGIVVLWRHKETEEKLAVKTCKWDDELTAKHRERWTKEVEMLQCCNNPNIVGTKQLPPEFVTGLARANPSKLPILCMEYCSGGDLRQVLNKPDSCCGLKEIQVRKILNDIGSAMQFLHNNKITHRDLKPENIVLHVPSDPQNQANVTYKLIDLGYAKEIDSNSVCASFVGTLQYLAPELIYSKTYSNSVDFWSLGLLAFEIICGTRPFLPFMAPVQWMPHVKKKAHENICVYETFHGDIEYSNEIFPENRISKPFQKLMERWLQVALEWDPKLRGRDAPSKVTFNIPTEEKGAASKVVIFKMLQDILSKKIIKIFSVTTLAQLAYEIDETTTIYNLKLWIYKETNIKPQDQVILSQLSLYLDITDEEVVTKYWNESSAPMLYLYNRNQIFEDNVAPVVPKAVQRCLEHHKALYNFKNCLNLYRNGLYFVLTQMDNYDSLVNALFAIAESLKQKSTQLLLKHNTIDKASGKLLAKQEVISTVMEIAKKHVEQLKHNNRATNLLADLDKTFNDFGDITDKISKLQTAWSQLSVRMQSAVRRCNEGISNDLNGFIAKNNYHNVFVNALKSYSKSYNGSRDRERQCPEIVKFCYDCLKLRNKILLELTHQPFLYKIKDLNIEIPKITDVVTTASDNVEKFTNILSTISADHTNLMWSTITLVVNDAQKVADQPKSEIAHVKKDFRIGESVSNHRFNILNKTEDETLKSLIAESLKLRHSHMSLCDKLNSQQKSLQKNLYDFSFLKE